ncbi:MAG: alpha/beta hydrolase, partial [Alistipes sp.]|nr:alpha/beta hydrolase [Alistipes sp.]
ASKIIEQRRAKAGSADYNNASPMMRAILSKCVNEDLCHLMPKIKASTLLFWGENDTATPLADAKRMEKLIPDAGLVTVAGAGHYSFLENMPLFVRVLESFLAKDMKKE